MNVFKTLTLFSIFSIGLISSAQENGEKKAKAFNLIDADKNEVITIREMRSFYKEKMDQSGEPINGKKLFHGLDANQNSIITLNEFVEGVNWKLAYTLADKWYKKPSFNNIELQNEAENTKQIEKFEKIDTNKNNELSFSELVYFYVNMKDESETSGGINFYALDINNDDIIVFDEFIQEPNWKSGFRKFVKAEKEINLPKEEKVTEDYLNKRVEMFNEADVDTNYRITLKELKEFYKGKKNKSGNPINAELRFYGLDTNDDGGVDLVEFSTKIDWRVANEKYKARKE